MLPAGHAQTHQRTTNVQRISVEPLVWNLALFTKIQSMGGRLPLSTTKAYYVGPTGVYSCLIGEGEWGGRGRVSEDFSRILYANFEHAESKGSLSISIEPEHATSISFFCCLVPLSSASVGAVSSCTRNQGASSLWLGIPNCRPCCKYLG